MQIVIRFCVPRVPNALVHRARPLSCDCPLQAKEESVLDDAHLVKNTVRHDESARMLSGFTNRKGVCALTCGFSIRLCFPAPSHYLASMIVLYDDDCSTSPSHDKDNFIQSLDKNCPKPEVRVTLNFDTFLLIIVIKTVIVRININNTQPLNSKRHDPQLLRFRLSSFHRELPHFFTCLVQLIFHDSLPGFFRYSTHQLLLALQCLQKACIASFVMSRLSCKAIRKRPISATATPRLVSSTANFRPPYQTHSQTKNNMLIGFHPKMSKKSSNSIIPM